ncbi:hypothetical protein J8J14_22310 [Roseomonas sp. SSH11]|uniref:DUF3467 domain-containing protein n=1 Tax=Pararoseomonas baculiformis TaxID=2820812 RepID=A0ABS4AKE6_9PROT|nr:hypothetical protein [Pararoseomonas baculiformis]MBP0447498.1 hypothetical protein [Pararoseomonas baculiformis]
MPDTQTLFADGVIEASVRHGVARLKLAVQDGSGTPSPTGMLVVPLAQLPAMAGAITRLLREVEAKARESQGQNQAANVAPVESPEPAAAFRFQG